jgi:hypothetical protein
MQSLLKLATPHWNKFTAQLSFLTPVVTRVGELWEDGVELVSPHLHHVEPLRNFAQQGWEQV